MPAPTQMFFMGRAVCIVGCSNQPVSVVIFVRHALICVYSPLHIFSQLLLTLAGRTRTGKGAAGTHVMRRGAMGEDKLHRMEIKITRTDSVRDVAKVNKQHLKQLDINKSSSFCIFFLL